MTWHDFTGGEAVTAAEFVTAAQNLLESAVTAAGGSDQARDEFVAGLAACFSTTGPYATLRLDTGPLGPDVRNELAANVDAVSAFVLDLIGTATAPRAVDDVHSTCVGYAWIPPVVRRLTSGPGLHSARNLYNEWLWQLVLLRDALVPFTNPGQVRVRAGAEGLTHLQGARDWFAVQVMTRRIAHEAIVRFAAETVVGEPAGGAYGFQHAGAAVLPPVALGGPLLGPRYLLHRYETAVVPEETAFFVPGPATAAAEPSGRLVPGPPGADRTRTLTLTTEFEGAAWAVDLGAALRGHRYAARPSAEAATVDSPPPGSTVIPTGGRRARTLALLARLHPGNVVLYTGQAVEGSPVLLDIRG
ncbi:hypothetical protein GCM10022222_10340 [Amycolatopsis ultiminotia]|uniref:Uncharacterized protein n=1 Tax=Amycolatopsis ultiminotia TaxID=543629 RepID=A0ABP6V5S3_9PSEU